MTRVKNGLYHICKRPRPAYMSVPSDQGLCYPLTTLFDTVKLCELLLIENCLMTYVGSACASTVRSEFPMVTNIMHGS